MNTRADGTRRQLATFLGLTFALSAVFWWLIVAVGSLGAHGGLFVFALMWCPGVSALVTRLIFQHTVRGEGWRWGRDTTRWAAIWRARAAVPSLESPLKSSLAASGPEPVSAGAD